MFFLFPSVFTQVDQPEWRKRKEAFSELFANVKAVFKKICSSPNRELVYNLYTYIWDMVGVMSMLLSYVDWLALGHFSPQYKQLIVGRHTWFSGDSSFFPVLNSTNCSLKHELLQAYARHLCRVIMSHGSSEAA